ncbi:MAG: insulinase family protein, partial [bacterium]|nr:insulinase family protein [bacterium]
MIHSTKHNTAIVKKHRSRVGKSLPLAALLLLLLSGAYAFALPGADADEPGTYSPGSVIEAGVIWKNAPEKITCNSKKGDFSFIFHPDASSEITTLRVFIKGGKRAEPVNRKGTAFIATRLAMEVTELRDVRKIMTMGSSSMTQVEADYSVITINCLTEHFRDTLKIFSSYMRNPLLSSIRISNIKSALKHYQKNENDQPEHAVLKVLHDVFFGEDGYGGSIYGTKESLKKIKRKDVISFHKTYFNLANMVIVISSDMAKEKVKKIISDYFGTLPKGEPHPLAAVKRVPDGPSKGGELNDGAAKSKEHFIEKENTQSLITVAVPLPGMNVS